MSMIAKNRIKSTWTPLSNEETNNKIFEERRILVGKWYDKWTDEQRRRLLEDLVKKSKNKQLDYALELIKEKVPAVHKDFTRMLPRVITLYLMSFLDPRSLCRCSRVCWYWKYLSELDQLWMPKCLRLGWFISFTPSPFENGVWKRNYLEHIKSLQVLRPSESPHIELEKLNLHVKRPDKNRTKKTHQQPWRGSDPVPKDTWRYNVLENDDIVETVGQMRKKKTYPSDDNLKSAKSKLNTHQSLSLTRRSQSMSKLHSSVTSMTSPDRPKWAIHTAGAPFMNRNSTLQNGIAGSSTRPNPSSPPPKTFRPITVRSERDPPTSELFPSKPWKVLDGNMSDED